MELEWGSIAVKKPGGPISKEAQEEIDGFYAAPRYGGGYWIAGEYPENGEQDTTGGIWVELIDHNEETATFVVRRTEILWNLILPDGSLLFDDPRRGEGVRVGEYQDSQILTLDCEMMQTFRIVNEGGASEGEVDISLLSPSTA